MEILLAICTVLGGVTAALFILQRLAARKRKVVSKTQALKAYLIGPQRVKPDPFEPGTYAPEFDKTLRERNPRFLQRLNAIRAEVDPQLQRIPRDDFCGDSSGHAREVLRLQAALYPTAIEQALSARELFLLATLCLVHDWGMMPPGKVDSGAVYARHGERSGRLFAHADLPVSAEETQQVCSLCDVHNRGISVARPVLNSINSGNRLLLLYCMLRVADFIEVKLQAPSLAGTSSCGVSKIIGTFRIDSGKGRILVCRNLDNLDPERFRIAVQEVRQIVRECSSELEAIGYKYSVRRQ